MRMTEIENEPEDDPESEYIIDPTSGEEHSLVYGFYSQIKAQKDHFSNMQIRYRSISSAWLLAAFAGIGLLLSQHNLQLPFNTLIGILILSFCTIFGLTLLWHLDIVLYQKLWLGTVVTLAKLEKDHKWLPRVNLNVLMIKSNKSYRFFQSIYYIGLNCVFILIGALASFIIFPISILNSSIIVILSISLMILMAKIMLAKSGEMEELTAESFID